MKAFANIVINLNYMFEIIKEIENIENMHLFNKANSFCFFVLVLNFFIKFINFKFNFFINSLKINGNLW